MDPEYGRERTELYWEKRRLSEKMEKNLLDRLTSGQETMSDVVTCPNASCRNPLQVKFLEDRIELICPNCEFRQALKKD